MTRAERNRNRTDGCYCWRCGDSLDEAQAVWLVAGNGGDRFFATEADAGEDNMGGFPFGTACARRQLRADALGKCGSFQAAAPATKMLEA